MVFVTQNTEVKCPDYAIHALEYMSGFERWARKIFHNVCEGQIEKMVRAEFFIS